MSYTLNWSDPSKPTITLAQNTHDLSSTSLHLVGKKTPDWGEPVMENFLRLLENFRKSTPPLNPTPGQLWVNSVTGVVNVCNASGLFVSAALSGGSINVLDNSGAQLGYLVV